MHSSLIVFGKLFQLKSFPVQFKQTKKFRYAPDLTISIFNGMERDMEEDGENTYNKIERDEAAVN